MATAKEQLLANMNPQMARLLDNQMRDQQVAQRSRGAGMLSGVAQAYTGMGDLAARALGAAPMGANEMQAIQAQKQAQQAEALRLAEEAEEKRRYENQFKLKQRQADIAEQKFFQDSQLFAQNRKRNELLIEQTEQALERNEGMTDAVGTLLDTMEGLSEFDKNFAQAVEPTKALEFLKAKEANAIKQRKIESAMQTVNTKFFGVGDTEAINSTALNNRYLASISYLKKQGLSEEAADMEAERAARVDQKKTVEEREQSVKEKWDSNESVKINNKRISAANQGLALLEQGGGLAQLAAQVSFFKSIDPDSVVKESEIEMANNAAGLLDAIEAAMNKTSGEGILSRELKGQLQDFFALSGGMAVESYNNKLQDQKLRYDGRGMDVDFMFGSEASLNKPVTMSPSSYMFNLDNLNSPVNDGVLDYMQKEYRDLGNEPKKALMGYYNQLKGNPEGLKKLRENAMKQYGFDALGYMLYQGGQ